MIPVAIAMMINSITNAETITRRPRKVETFGPSGSFFNIMNSARNRLKTMKIIKQTMTILNIDNVVFSQR